MTDYRTKVDIKFEPVGEDTAGAITIFQLVKITEHESRRSGGHWYQDSTHNEPYKREIITGGLTRRKVCDIVQDGADWLTYIEGDTS